MNIEQTQLIQMLISNPLNDRDNGWNQAVICLLKGSITESEQDKILRYFNEAAQSVGINNQRYFDNDDVRMLNSIVENIKENRLLQGVKELKDATGFGLKESKDVIDIVKINYQIKQD